MFPSLSKIKQALLDVLFPPACVACEKQITVSEIALCATCLESMPINDSLTCPVCGARLAENKKTCHAGAKFRLAAATGYGNETVKNIIWKLKFQKKTAAAPVLAGILNKHLALLPINLSSFSIVPIPLHPARERERHFNQSELIAKNLSSKTGLALIGGALVRTKTTKPQSGIRDYGERKNNIAGSFAIKYPELIKNKNVLLVDDVFTSGSTMNEAVRTLKSAGVKKIIAAVAAKAG